MVSELLDMLHKTEQSLARVRKNKAADVTAAAGGSEITNIQKISLQLLLDIKVDCCNICQYMLTGHMRVHVYILDQSFALQARVVPAGVLSKWRVQGASCLAAHQLQCKVRQHSPAACFVLSSISVVMCSPMTD